MKELSFFFTLLFFVGAWANWDSYGPGEGYLKEQGIDMKDLLGDKSSKSVTNGNIRRQTYDLEDNDDFPLSWDAREVWGSCIGPVKDQGKCGSCWAVSMVSTASDRLCISKLLKNETAEYIELSALQTVACDKGILEPGDNKGCQGGYPAAAWDYLETTGVLTESCMPYLTSDGGKIDTCTDQPCLDFEKTPACPFWNMEFKHQCHDESEPWKKYNSQDSYYVQLEEQMMTDMMKWGPIQASIDVYEDFEFYKSGVYSYTYGDYVGGHAIKIVGWGVEQSSNTSYWQLQNSWTDKWGDNGYIKVLKGTCEINICNLCSAGRF